jgi:menaquinol-cytochrome c reductase cytochrome b/c subunit
MAETPKPTGSNGQGHEGASPAPVGSPPNPFDTQPRVPQRQDVGRQMLGERERTYRLLALVKGDVFSKPKHRMMADEVMVWPDLVVLEMLSAVVFTFLLLLLSMLANAPLEGLADPTATPNPSKAPWYFMNLQELLLHMHPALAGVIVPIGALVLIALIPYYDTDPRGVGVYFTTAAGRAITVFSYIYSTVLCVLLVLFDKFTVPDPTGETGSGGLRYVFAWLIGPLSSLGTWETPAGALNLGAFTLEVILPLIPIFAFSWLLLVIVKQRWGGNPRYYCIALFTGFVAAYVVLTIIGTAFRGPGMNLYWPWAMPPRTH